MENTAAIHVGRLVEVRVLAGYRSAADVDTLLQAIGRCFASRRYKQYVLVADWRRCPIMSTEAAARAIEGMTRNNERLERSAAVGSPHSPSLVLQFMRMIRDSNNPQRRLFNDAETLFTWIGAILTPEEQTRLRAFLEGK